MMIGFSHFEGGRAVTRAPDRGRLPPHRLPRRAHGPALAAPPRRLPGGDGGGGALRSDGWSRRRRRRPASRSAAISSATRWRKMPTLDAVFCNNDDLALGVLFECHRAVDRRARQRSASAGFNDLDMMQVAYPVGDQHPHASLRDRPAGDRDGAGGDRRRSARSSASSMSASN